MCSSDLRCSPKQKRCVESQQRQREERRTAADHSRVKPNRAENHNPGHKSEGAQGEVARPKKIAVETDEHWKWNRKRFVLKILCDLGDARHSREIHHGTFVPPKRAGVRSADH